MRSRTFVVVGLLLTALVLGLAGDADAQGRKKRGKRGKKPKGETTSAKATLILTSGKEIEKVTIKAEKFKEIQYRERRGTSKIAGEKVAEIVYDPQPPAFATGMSQYRAGLFKKAVTSFTAARNQAKPGSWAEVYASYWLGESHLLAGDHEEAGKAFQKVLDTDKEHFLAPAAIYGLGRAQTGQSSYTKAVATFNRLKDEYGTYWGAKGMLGAGYAFLKQKKPADARKNFEIGGDRAKRGRDQRDRDLEKEARVGVGKCHIADKRWDKALQFFDGIINTAGVAADVAGGAWVGKGDCRVAQAKEKGSGGKPDANFLKEALIAYQTCVVRFAGTPEAYPKALSKSADLYDQLGLPDLAKRMREELKNRCPNSPWAEKLKK